MENSKIKSEKDSIKALVALVESLRSEPGCPWDKKQTPRTMLIYLIEEMYELVDAIESNRAEEVREELGDARIDERRSESLKWNRNVPYGLRGVEGRNLSIYPMVRYAKFLRDLDTDHPENLDLLRVRFLLRGPGEEAPPAEYPLVFADAGERVYLNRDIRPPAWLEGSGAGEVTLERFGRQEIAYRVSADGPALLVTSERWYPGWRAFVDGRERPVEPAHGILRAVALEGGEEEVLFRYREERFAAGMSITVLSLAAAVVLLFFGLVRRRGPSKGESL